MPNNHLVTNKLNPSRHLVMLLVFIHGLTVWAVLLLPFSTSAELPVKSFLFILVVFSCFYYFNKMQNVTAVIMKDDNCWDLSRSDGSSCVGIKLVGSYISDWLVILVFSGEDGIGRHYAYLSVDTVEKTIFSNLKCKLKINNQEIFQE